MTQEQIEIEVQNYLNGLDLPENADKQLILDNFKNGMAWAMMLIKEEKQQLMVKHIEILCSLKVEFCLLKIIIKLWTIMIRKKIFQVHLNI